MARPEPSSRELRTRPYARLSPRRALRRPHAGEDPGRGRRGGGIARLGNRGQYHHFRRCQRVPVRALSVHERGRTGSDLGSPCEEHRRRMVVSRELPRLPGARHGLREHGRLERETSQSHGRRRARESASRLDEPEYACLSGTKSPPRPGLRGGGGCRGLGKRRHSHSPVLAAILRRGSLHSRKVGRNRRKELRRRGRHSRGLRLPSRRRGSVRSDELEGSQRRPRTRTPGHGPHEGRTHRGGGRGGDLHYLEPARRGAPRGERGVPLAHHAAP